MLRRQSGTRERVAIGAALAAAAALALAATPCLINGGEPGELCLLPVPKFLHKDGGAISAAAASDAEADAEADADAATRKAVAWALVAVAAAALAPAAILWAGLCRGPTGPDADKSRALGYLYMSHFLSAWGDRMWQMAVPVLFMDMFRNTLLPTAVYTLVVYLVVVQLMPYAGAWIDLSDRLRVQQVACTVENMCIISTSVLICYVVASDPSEGVTVEHLSDSRNIVWFSALVVLGCVGEVLNGSSTISLEKDWVVILAHNLNIPVGGMNTFMRRIDLFCKSISPAVYTLLYEMFGESLRRRLFFGTGLVGLWNVFSYVLELMLLRLVYEAFPVLEAKLHEHADGTRHSHKLGDVEHFHIGRVSPDGSVKLDPEIVLSKDRANMHRSASNVMILSGQQTHGHGHSHGGSAHHHAHGLCRGDGHDKDQLLVSDADQSPLLHAKHTSSSGYGTASSSTLLHHHHTDGSPTCASVEHAHEHADVPHYHVARLSPQGEEVITDEIILEAENLELGAALDKPILVTVAADERRSMGVIRSFVVGVRVYQAEFVFLASVAYTLLYMTVLDNGALMTSYLEWSKVDTFYFGVGRGVGALFGLAGTFAFPLLVARLGNSLGAAGLVSLWLFFASLVPASALMLFEPNTLAADYALIASMAFSRMWLWAFDLVVTELCQTYVSETNRGVFGSVQTASYQLFYAVIQVAGIVSPDPAHFTVLVQVSVLVVLLAAILYTVWYLRVYQPRFGSAGAAYDSVSNP